MNCFPTAKKVTSTSSPRRKPAPPALQNIPTILEIQDFSGFLKTTSKQDDTVFENSHSSNASTGSASQHSEPLRRLSFRLGSDAEESNNSSSQRTTPSYSTGNLIFDFENILSQCSSTSSTPSPKVLSIPTSTLNPGGMFLDIPKDPFQTTCGPITNSHSSDKLVSNANLAASAAAASRSSTQTNGTLHALHGTPKLHLSRSCSMLTKGVFGGGKRAPSKERISVRSRRRSSQIEQEEISTTAQSTDTLTTRKSSDPDQAATESSIFARLLHRWHVHQQNGSVPAHALFLRYSSEKKKTKKSSRSHSETEAMEKTVKQRLRQMVRRNTESVLKSKANSRRNTGKSSSSPRQASSNRPSPEEARSWGTSFEILLASHYGLALFRAFLQLEYSEENLSFYLACEKFKNIESSGNRKLATKAQKIYDEFIRVDAPREVNLDSLTRATTVTNLANPNRHCFDHAQRRVRHVLEKDVYPRFLKFDLYTQLTVDASSPLPPIS